MRSFQSQLHWSCARLLNDITDVALIHSNSVIRQLTLSKCFNIYFISVPLCLGYVLALCSQAKVLADCNWGAFQSPPTKARLQFSFCLVVAEGMSKQSLCSGAARRAELLVLTAHDIMHTRNPAIMLEMSYLILNFVPLVVVCFVLCRSQNSSSLKRIVSFTNSGQNLAPHSTLLLSPFLHDC